MESAALTWLGTLGLMRLIEQSFDKADVYVYAFLAVTALVTPNAFGSLMTYSHLGSGVIMLPPTFSAAASKAACLRPPITKLIVYDAMCSGALLPDDRMLQAHDD